MTKYSTAVLALSLCLAGAALANVAGRAEAQTAGGEDELNCLVEPHRVVQVASPVDGVLAAVEVERGDLVTMGQVIAVLESGVEEAAVATARARAASDVEIRASRARLAFEAQRLKRGAALLKKNVISSSEMDENHRDADLARLALEESELNQRLAQLELKRAQQVLERRTTRSPINGVVVDRFLSPGEYVYDQAPIAKIAEIDRLNVEVFVPIARYGRIHVDMPAEVRMQAPIGGRHRAKVVTLDRVLDAASGTFRVRLELPNPELWLPAGVRCTVRFAEEQSE